MDETNVKQGVKTSAGAGGSTSQETELLPEATVKAMVSKAKSDALADLGRYKKAADDAVKQVQAIEERLSRMQEERFESELESAKDDPDRLREIRQRQRDVKERMSTEAERRSWEAEKTELNERVKRAEVIERRELAKEVATEFQVDYKALERFGTDRESMAELAKSLLKSGQNNQGSRVTEPPEGGKTSGNRGALTKEQASKMGPDEANANQKALAEMSF